MTTSSAGLARLERETGRLTVRGVVFLHAAPSAARGRAPAHPGHDDVPHPARCTSPFALCWGFDVVWPPSCLLVQRRMAPAGFPDKSAPSPGAAGVPKTWDRYRTRSAGRFQTTAFFALLGEQARQCREGGGRVGAEAPQGGSGVEADGIPGLFQEGDQGEYGGPGDGTDLGQGTGGRSMRPARAFQHRRRRARGSGIGSRQLSFRQPYLCRTAIPYRRFRNKIMATAVR
jgi:hypothetical protein